MSGDRPGTAPRPGYGAEPVTQRPRPDPHAALRQALQTADPSPQDDVAPDWFAQVKLYIAAGVTVLSLLVVAVNIGIFLIDRAVQRDVNQRQQQINEGTQLNRVDQILVRALAEQAASAHDDTLRDLLNRNGVTFQMTPQASKAPTQAVAPAASSAPTPPTTPAPTSPPPGGTAPAGKD